jgi:hypothetical protein
VAAGAREFNNTLQSLSRERVMYFFALTFVGALMLTLAFFIGVPTLALAGGALRTSAPLRNESCVCLAIHTGESHNHVRCRFECITRAR